MPAKPKCTILSVGEKGPRRRALRRTLEGAGLRVIDAGTAADAIRLLRKTPELVILHSGLPDANEHDLCRRIKSDPVCCHIPVVHLAREGAAGDDGAQAIAAGAEAHLDYPADPPLLLSTVHVLLRDRRLEEEREQLLLSGKVTLPQAVDEASRVIEQRFRHALRRVPIAVWNQDRDLRYTWVYNAPPGFGSSDPIGKTDEDLLTAADLPAVLAIKRRVLATGIGARQQIALTVDGEVRSYDVILEPLHNDSGETVGLSGAAIDMTEHTRLEAKLRQAQKLESIGVLAGGVAHDFNNLLTGILGNASLALDQMPPEHPARPEIEAVMSGAQRAAELTSQLLAYAGKGQFVLEQVDLSKLVQDILSLIRTSIPKTVRLHLALKPNLPATSGDGAQLQQLIMNLIINAGEAIGDQPGTIRINTGVQEISQYYIERNSEAAANEAAPGSYVYIEVRDTGCGMDEDTKARIFDPFFTTKFTGRGLGLAAVQGIVRGHRGVIELHSTPARGTTFKVLFPAAVRRERSEEDLRGSGTILVVDDDDLIRHMTRTVLEKHGYSVRAAADGEAAVEIFRQSAGEIAAVLLDTSMPEMNGIAAFQQIAAIRPDVPVIVSSGYPESEVLRQLPADARPLFIQKPYSARRVLDMIRTATTRVPA